MLLLGPVGSPCSCGSNWGSLASSHCSRDGLGPQNQLLGGTGVSEGLCAWGQGPRVRVPPRQRGGGCGGTHRGIGTRAGVPVGQGLCRQQPRPPPWAETAAPGGPGPALLEAVAAPDSPRRPALQSYKLSVCIAVMAATKTRFRCLWQDTGQQHLLFAALLCAERA